MSWLIVVALAVGGLCYAALPLSRAPRRGKERDEVLAAELNARKRAALLGIVDLEDEREVGKLNDEDFAALRSEYEAEAMVAIAELDQLHAPEDDLEREIAELRARLAEDDNL